MYLRPYNPRVSSFSAQYPNKCIFILLLPFQQGCIKMTKLLASATVLNINNNKYLLSTKSAYLKEIMKDHVILETGVLAAENSTLSSKE